MQDTQQYAWSVTSRFNGLNKAQFSDEIEKRWQVIERVKDLMVDQVDEGNITPVEAMKVLASSTGTLLGYEEFHPRGIPGSPESLVAELYGAIGSRSRAKVPA